MNVGMEVDATTVGVTTAAVGTDVTTSFVMDFTSSLITQAITTTPSEVAAASDDPLKHVRSLLLVLIQSFSALGLGFACIRYGFLDPSRGDMQGIQFYVGRVALPLVVFKIVSTAKIAEIEFGVILACTLGKVSVFVLTFCMSLCAYRSKLTTGKRLLSAGLFGFFTTASNDLAVGIPVVQTVYGNTMSVYLAANVLVFQTVLQPLITILFEFGHALDVSASAPGDADGDSVGGMCRARVREILMMTLRSVGLNPIMVATWTGMLYNLLLNFTLVQQDSGDLRLPEPLNSVVNLWTSPCAMLFLFLNGTALRSASVGLWPCMLALMKVLLCSYISYGLSQVFVNPRHPMAQTLKEFTFFYGTIPAGGAPLIYAQVFDCGVEVIASASILCLMLAGPIEFMTALFLGTLTGHVNYAHVRLVMFQTARASALCAGVFVVFVAVGWWGGSFSSKAIGVYGVLIFFYEVYTSFMMEFPGKLCRPRELVVYQFLQNVGYVLVVYIEYHLGTRWREGRRARSFVVVVIVLGVAAAVTWIVPIPNTYHEFCYFHMESRPCPSLRLPAWNACLLAAIVAFAVCGRLFKTQAKGVLPRRSRRKSSISALMPLLCRVRETVNEVSPTSFADADNDSTFTQEGMLPGGDGVGVATCLVVLQGVRSLMGFINAMHLWWRHTAIEQHRAFAPMLILEDVLEHGMGIFLLLAVMFQPGVMAEVKRLLSVLAACGCWGGMGQGGVIMPDVEPHVLPPQEPPASAPTDLRIPITPFLMPRTSASAANLRAFVGSTDHDSDD